MASFKAFIDLLDRPRTIRSSIISGTYKPAMWWREYVGWPRSVFPSFGRPMSIHAHPSQNVTGCGVIHSFIDTMIQMISLNPGSQILSPHPRLSLQVPMVWEHRCTGESQGHQVKEDIALAMWLSYQEELEQRG